ncbi:3-hydroxyisobutyrate dehydrogenase [Spizellomyces punctatus DAOM BR117]|uniref:3-hydroxyisobutyrate dehydrogenase n=1 Tax=Spizellomyces punctatus (strain DAOM BR117) TaxID=645134 RepID=A0A0L0H5N6_SPIPD|nr:3-hydroxyisobutyrate dehydrogenase [Spizellomyces punctatus DAOM BR117]KNC96216.1 3-hydroxyisobutyrate dehydrogenase [Spizellomyces punctatus DAOM BR117]|eukprot:XP_016604256.1 3-hydroxyisobutyrate dehydrogenase [Spizellomyces punctatus DAOM BR117]
MFPIGYIRVPRSTWSVGRRFYSSEIKKTIGFIGLGQMGYPMAQNLHEATKNTHKFIIYDNNARATTNFTSSNSGTKAASTPRDVAAESDILFTMLPASAHVRAVYEGSDGVLEGVTPGTICVDCSTIDVRTARDVAKNVEAKQAVMLDAPVSGGTPAAQNGTLTFMVGAPQSQFEGVKEFLQKMGKNVFYCGENGTGQAAKICNNMMLGICMVGASETFNLGLRLGLEPELLNKILNTSSGRSWSTDTYHLVPGLNPNVPASKDYEGGFGVSLMAKDLGLAVSAATEVKSSVMLGSAAEQLYKIIAGTEGYEKKDFSVVFRWLGGEKIGKGKGK